MAAACGELPYKKKILVRCYTSLQVSFYHSGASKLIFCGCSMKLSHHCQKRSGVSMTQQIYIKGLVYHLSHDCHFDIDCNVLTVHCRF